MKKTNFANLEKLQQYWRQDEFFFRTYLFGRYTKPFLQVLPKSITNPNAILDGYNKNVADKLKLTASDIKTKRDYPKAHIYGRAAWDSEYAFIRDEFVIRYTRDINSFSDEIYIHSKNVSIFESLYNSSPNAFIIFVKDKKDCTLVEKKRYLVRITKEFINDIKNHYIGEATKASLDNSYKMNQYKLSTASPYIQVIWSHNSHCNETIYTNTKWDNNSNTNIGVIKNGLRECVFAKFDVVATGAFRDTSKMIKVVFDDGNIRTFKSIPEFLGKHDKDAEYIKFVRAVSRADDKLAKFAKDGSLPRQRFALEFAKKEVYVFDAKHKDDEIQKFMLSYKNKLNNSNKSTAKTKVAA